MRRAGFTLVEVLVGLTVAGLALAAGFATLAFVADRAGAAETAARGALEGAAARTVLVDWLSGARLAAPNLVGTFQGLEAEENALANDELIFPTTARTPLQVPNAMIRLYIDDDRDTPERGLVAEMVERQQDEPRRFELVPEAVSLEIRFLPGVDGPAEWQDGWLGRNVLPRAVELVLGAAPGDSLPPLLRHPIRVTLGTLR